MRKSAIGASTCGTVRVHREHHLPRRRLELRPIGLLSPAIAEAREVGDLLPTRIELLELGPDSPDGAPHVRSIALFTTTGREAGIMKSIVDLPERNLLPGPLANSCTIQAIAFCGQSPSSRQPSRRLHIHGRQSS